MNTITEDRIRRESDRTRIVGIEYPHTWTWWRIAVYAAALGWPLAVAIGFIVAGMPLGAVAALGIQVAMIFGFASLILSRTGADAEGLTDWQYGFLPQRWPWSDITGFTTRRKVRNGEEGEISTYPISVAARGQWVELAILARDQEEADTFIAALSERRGTRRISSVGAATNGGGGD